MKTIFFSEIHYLILEAIQKNLKNGRIRSITVTCDDWLKNCGTPVSVGTIHAFVKKLESLNILKEVNKTKSIKHGKKTRLAAVYEYNHQRFEELNIMPKGSIPFKSKGEISTDYLLDRKKVLEERIALYLRIAEDQRKHLAKVLASLSAIAKSAAIKELNNNP